jgi:two-component system sensor histidine kinase KdpD
MIDDKRPDPESLLSAIRKEEKKHDGGNLKIFFGMAAGVGKTYAMLEEAQQRVKEGVNVVVGVIETHGRRETQALLDGLEIIPLKKIIYKNTSQREMDLDAILAKKPQLVIVDELAHTNVPGSRHPKRWQDVLELLNTGIDVYTTINVQHVESRKDDVESITGITIRETVPDMILERANHIEIVDIPPNDLLKRLKEGKVYLGHQSEIAAKNFFREERLMALRDIALRFTAEKVEHELHGIMTVRDPTRMWRANERLMVAVTCQPNSLQLIRTARRIAFKYDCPWYAVHVNDGTVLSPDDHFKLARNLGVCRDLGGEVISTSDPNVLEALVRIAQQKNITQIIIGRSSHTSFTQAFLGGSFLDRLSSRLKDIDILVVKQEAMEQNVNEKNNQKHQWVLNYQEYLYAVGFIVLLTIFFQFMVSAVGYKVIGLFYLMGILVLSVFISSKGPLLIAAGLSTVLLDAIFIPPSESRQTSEPEDFVLVLVYFIVALIASFFSNRIKLRERLLREKEAETTTIYDIAEEIAKAPSQQELIRAVIEKVEETLQGECKIIVKSLDTQALDFNIESAALNDEKEKAVAVWVFEKGKTAGFSTETLPSVEYLYIPLKGFKSVIGVMAFRPKKGKELNTGDFHLLHTVAQQIGSYLDRTLTEEFNRREELQNQIEKVYKTILTSISTEFKNPLESLSGATHQLKQEKGNGNKDLRTKSLQLIEESSNVINRIVDNIMAMSKLSSGFIHLQKELWNPSELVEASIDSLKNKLKHHHVVLNLEKDIPLLSYDFSLMQMALCNVIINAVEYSPKESTIEISCLQFGNKVKFTVADEGPGIPQQMISKIFDKFYRVPGTSVEGVGVGLSIVKSIVELHDGEVEATNLPIKGAEFTILLPFKNSKQ